MDTQIYRRETKTHSRCATSRTENNIKKENAPVAKHTAKRTRNMYPPVYASVVETMLRDIFFCSFLKKIGNEEIRIEFPQKKRE
jgi:hypothetical protein